MPLDPVAKRYAHTLFVDALEELTRKHSARKSEAIAALAKRNILPHTAGYYHSEMARLGLEHIADITEAKVNALLAAHERAAIPIDDQAVEEINREAVEWSEAQGKNLTANIQEQISRAGMPETASSALAETIAREVSSIEVRIYRKLSAIRDEQIMAARTKWPDPIVATKWDVFISHASEDKDFVRPLADALRAKGIRVWYDEFELKVGDHLRRSIDKGLVHSQYGVVVLSPAFFAKHWPQTELDGLAAKEVGGEKVILPVWHNMEFAGVREYSPTLAERVAAKTSEGLERVVERLLEAVASKASNDAGAKSTVSGSKITPAVVNRREFHLTEGARVRIAPIVPREHEQSEFTLQEDAGECFVFQKTDSQRYVDIPKSFIENIHKFSDSRPALLQLTGRLQWVSTKRNFELFPEKPSVGPAGAYGIGKEVDSGYPVRLGVQGKFGREDRLPEILGRGWRIFYDSDGTYLRWGKQVFVVDWV